MVTGVFLELTIGGKSQFSAHNHGIVGGPEAITDGSPGLVVADLNTTFKLIGSIGKTNGCVLTVN